MTIDYSALDWLVSMTRKYQSQISLGLMATLLAIYGQDINRWVRHKTRHQHFIVRTTVFIFLCTFGYGWFTIFCAPHLSGALSRLPPRFLPGTVFMLFVVLGVLAERKRKI